MRDDSTPTAEQAVARDPRRRAAAGGRRDRAARLGDRRGGLRGRPQRGGRGDRRDAAARHRRRRCSCCCSPSTARRSWRSCRWGRRARLPRRRRRHLRARGGRADERQRPDDGDPDRADVRRGHRLLPADRRPLPRRAAPGGGRGRRDGAGGGAHRRRRSSRRARSSSWRCSRSRWPTSTPRARWGRSSRWASRSWCSPGSRCCRRCSTVLGRRAFWPAVPRTGAGAPRGSRTWAAVAGLVRRRPAATAAAVTRAAGRGRARRAGRARAARLRRLVPRPAAVRRRRRTLIARALHPGPGRAASAWSPASTPPRPWSARSPRTRACRSRRCT